MRICRECNKRVDVAGKIFKNRFGLFCEARLQRRVENLPLGELEVRKGTPNRQLVKDYCSWFWNYR